MTDGHHYYVDFITFSRILGFREEHRGYTYIHDEHHEISDIRYMWKDPCLADGKRSGLRSFYYIMNNIIRSTINPKDGAGSDINGYVGAESDQQVVVLPYIVIRGGLALNDTGFILV